jgi:adenylylsulfate kinase
MTAPSSSSGFTLWLTGLSGAGKSTLALRIQETLRRSGTHVELLDGDEVRRHLSAGLGFSKADRDTNVRRLGFVARLLSRNGVVVIVAAISPYRQLREEIRRVHDAPFVEVFVSCPLDELIRRDPKGLYARALRGEIQQFSGISDPYEPPTAPEITVCTDRESEETSAGRILQWLSEARLTPALSSAATRVP